MSFSDLGISSTCMGAVGLQFGPFGASTGILNSMSLANAMTSSAASRPPPALPPVGSAADVSLLVRSVRSLKQNSFIYFCYSTYRYIK